eukprot:TRINITY_DN60700_c0_g1_i1.p1 TRINITY_DN60700_c0_g1~~TRINITY_DN60700_c0_g1_i1.p1  ORF type:complete len:434 (+),score=183.71 TRINITY_DN60700_c0_g1_i1:96-1304(+)
MQGAAADPQQLAILRSRVRTESMIDRLGRKQLGEGYDLWDKDFPLSALRLFQCKLEVAPPFEVAACFDSIAEILSSLGEGAEAREHFSTAAEKYNTINKPVLSELMKVKESELGDGPQSALNKLVKFLEPFDHRRAQGKAGADLLGEEGKLQGPAVGRCYLYRAELLGGLERAEEGIVCAEFAADLQYERSHLAHSCRGDLLCALERYGEALGAYQAAVRVREIFFTGYESCVRCLRLEGREEEAIDYIDRAMKLHPKATLVRDKAFILSNLGKVDDAVLLLTRAAHEPPFDETEALPTKAQSEATLYKAKAAVLAEARRYEDANYALEHALRSVPDDEEADTMRREVFLTLGRDYLAKNRIPQYLDALVAMLLSVRPRDPLAFMAEMVEEDAIQIDKKGEV